jgi:hypothetical protein
VIRERLCLDWTRLDELRYRLHLKAVGAAIKGIPTQFQYFPLARDQREHYRRTGTVASIPLPTGDPASVHTAQPVATAPTTPAGGPQSVSVGDG